MQAKSLTGLLLAGLMCTNQRGEYGGRREVFCEQTAQILCLPRFLRIRNWLAGGCSFLANVRNWLAGCWGPVSKTKPRTVQLARSRDDSSGRATGPRAVSVQACDAQGAQRGHTTVSLLEYPLRRRRIPPLTRNPRRHLSLLVTLPRRRVSTFHRESPTLHARVRRVRAQG